MAIYGGTGEVTPVAYVIGEDSRGGASLAQLLAHDFEVRNQPAVYVDLSHEQIERIVDQRYFLLLQGHRATAGEVGCALAHRAVYEHIVESGVKWALVLESDAVVSRVEDLSERCLQVRHVLDASKPIVYSFFAGFDASAREHPPGPIPNSTRSPYPPAGAVGYLISLEAARVLSKLQDPIRSQADWPNDHLLWVLDEPDSVLGPAWRGHHRLEFYVDQSGLVTHNDNAISHIDSKEARPTSPKLFTLQVYCGLWYLRNWRSFRGMHGYFSTLIRPRLSRRYPAGIMPKIVRPWRGDRRSVD